MFVDNKALAKRDYYSIPMLKRPLWGWHIALYFFSEGISAGSFVISTMAEMFGGGRYDKLVRRARLISFATLLPCPPLLIADLGRPERFHHMLRVIKPSSPMSLGAWTMAAYGLPVAMAAVIEAADRLPEPLKRLAERLPVRFIVLTGLPAAIIMVAYPGVLLSATSTPVWSQSRFLGPLIACSSMSSATAALVLAISGGREYDAHSERTLRNLETITGLCETAVLALYLRSCGKAAEPLTRGRHAKRFWIAAVGAGIGVPLAFRTVEAAADKRPGRLAGITATLLTLAGGLMLKWVVVHAGRDSADDPAAAREATQPSHTAPGWMPSPNQITD
jgi:formate-dependent nitrite reductase membrane component NrfD